MDHPMAPMAPMAPFLPPKFLVSQCLSLALGTLSILANHNLPDEADPGCA